MNERPLAEKLFKTSPELRLIAGRHRRSGRIVFPAPEDLTEFDPVELPHQGTLWSYTIQRFAPKSPPYRADGTFAPYAVGYVELPGALIVESRLLGAAPDEWRIGMPLKLTTFALRTEDGVKLLMYAFEPQGARS